MLVFGFALICLCQSLLAVELSVYQSFTEVRQLHNGVGEYKYDFEDTEFQNIIDGSISWDGTPFARQEVYSTAQSLQDANVLVRRSTACECETIEAKIVDPASMLLQNLKTGAYFYADKQALEYTSVRPKNGGTILSFEFQDATTQHSGTLSYLMKGISWKPNYDLFLIGNNGDNKLRAYANIRNDQQREYTVENTNLLGGDVQLANGISNPRPPMRFSASMKAGSHLRPIEGVGEQHGLYSYLLKDKYTLRPSSSVRLPFIDITAKYRFYYKASTNVGSGQYQGVFDRNYDLTPDHFMPAGVITIRDGQVLVGQSNLPDVPENYTQTISVGTDNDVRYSVTGNLTSKTDANATVQLETYELDVELMNFKDKHVDAQLVLSGGLQVTLINTSCQSITAHGNRLDLPVQLEQGEHRTCKVNVKVRLS